MQAQRRAAQPEVLQGPALLCPSLALGLAHPRPPARPRADLVAWLPLVPLNPQPEPVPRLAFPRCWPLVPWRRPRRPRTWAKAQHGSALLVESTPPAAWTTKPNGTGDNRWRDDSLAGNPGTGASLA